MRYYIVKSRNKKELRAFIKKFIDPRSVIFTDGWTGYSGI